MAWVVDSCVLLDVALRDSAFGLPSALCLDRRRGDGLAVSPVSAIEISPEFGGRLANVHSFLSLLGADPHEPWLAVDTERSAEAWCEYVRRRRTDRLPKRPIADILIGAFACRFQGLVTRNPGHFSPAFPDLTLIDPAADGE